MTDWPGAPGEQARPTPTPIRNPAITPASIAAQAGVVLYPYQESISAAWLHPRRIVLKARQVGFSTIVAIEALATVLATPGATVLLISRAQDLAADLVRRCRQMLMRLPDAPALITDNDLELEFATTSRILSLSATRSAGRGFSPDLAVLDEFAYALYAEDIYQSVSPALAVSGGRMIIGSTPNGEGNAYADRWHNADADWQRFEIAWEECPVYYTPDERQAGIPPEQSAWYLANRPDYTERAWASEFGRSFAGSGDNVLAVDVIARAEVGAWGTCPRQPGRRYLTTVDVGRRRDATVINVLDVTTRPYQRVYHLRLERTPYPLIQQRIAETWRAYGGDLWVESNGVGDPVIENLDVPAKPFVTTAKSKVQAIQALTLLLEQGDLRAVWTAQERRELTQYRYDDADLTQDCVMSLAIAAATLRPQPKQPPPRSVSMATY